MSAASHSRRQRTAAVGATYGSSTMTTASAGPSIPLRPGTLRLRAEPEAEQEVDPSTQRRIQWADDVIDNEGMGKKSSKVCCIYHKPREAGESSDDESSSSSSSDSDSEPDTSRAQPANRRSNRQPHHHQQAHDGESCEHDHHHDQPDSKTKGKQKERKRSPNAYERVPKRKQPKDPK